MVLSARFLKITHSEAMRLQRDHFGIKSPVISFDANI